MSDNELLKQVYAQQVVVYKKLVDIENKLKGGTRIADLKAYQRELEKEASKIVGQLP